MAQASTSDPGAGKPFGTSDADEIREQLATLRKDVETLQRLLRESAETRFTSARAQAQDAFDEMRESARQKARHYQDEAEAAVRNNPTAALGIATGIGFIVGLLLSRR